MKRTSVEVESYYPEMVKRILRRCEGESFQHYLLVGFSEPMKWLSRLFADRGIPFTLCDWREEYVGYDCSNSVVGRLRSVSAGDASTCAILCCEEAEAKKEAILYLVESDLRKVPVIIEHDGPCDLFSDSDRYGSIRERALSRSRSLNSEDRLQVVTELVRETRHVAGDIAEFGTFNGGSAAFIVETLRALELDKRVFLFDSFGGMPAPEFGVDYRWDRSFANNSFAEVQAMFRDAPNVQVTRGHIRETIEELPETLSFVHVDVDTYETAQVVTEAVWDRLSPGGVLLYDDYGFYPNCMPLTAYVDRFFQSKQCFKLHLPTNTCFVVKTGSPVMVPVPAAVVEAGNLQPAELAQT